MIENMDLKFRTWLLDPLSIRSGDEIIFMRSTRVSQFFSVVSLGPFLELVSKELNHLAAILDVYAGGLNFMK